MNIFWTLGVACAFGLLNAMWFEMRGNNKRPPEAGLDRGGV